MQQAITWTNADLVHLVQHANNKKPGPLFTKREDVLP